VKNAKETNDTNNYVMQTFKTYDDLMNMEQRQRAHLINSIGGFKSVCLIGTADNNGHSNLAVFNSIVHIGANPPLICFVVRPDTGERHTLSNILATGFYSINHINENIYKQAHQTSARYIKEISEFDATGLVTEYKNNFAAPFVKESKVQLGVEFRQRIDITLNNTILIIGEINQLYYPPDCLCEDGYLDIEKAGTVTCTGLDSYHTTRRLGRLSYAKPDKEVATVTNRYLH
jgi:flavin reductase (DIM6/NTAB) family NADH-FMN oxidoreductase RutF